MDFDERVKELGDDGLKALMRKIHDEM